MEKLVNLFTITTMRVCIEGMTNCVQYVYMSTTLGVDGSVALEVKPHSSGCRFSENSLLDQ